MRSARTRSVNIIGYDPIWQSAEKVRFTLRHFQLLRAAGFTAVRINLAPFRAMDAKNNQQLSEAWLKVLDWAVRGALDNDLAVILDCHEFSAMGTDPKTITNDSWRFGGRSPRVSKTLPPT